jgi:YecR-like lipoprotein
MTLSKFAILPVFLVVAACSSAPQWNPDSSSRKLAVARVSYEYGSASEPVLSDAQAFELAQIRCNTWGYSSAEMIPGELQDCSVEAEGTCALWKVTREYQCSAGGGNAQTASR